MLSFEELLDFEELDNFWRSEEGGCQFLELKCVQKKETKIMNVFPFNLILKACKPENSQPVLHVLIIKVWVFLFALSIHYRFD